METKNTQETAETNIKPTRQTILPSFFDPILPNANHKFDASLSDFTDEQKQFIEDKEIRDGKLIAPPGSGKSRSILGRQIFLVKNGFFRKNEILLVTFTQSAAKDMQSRIEEIRNYRTYFAARSARTIDSMAKAVMDCHNDCKTNTKQIMSAWLRRFLQTATEKQLRTVHCLKNIKMLMVDEAQDLNRMQYDIVMKMKAILNLVVYMVGDPNQSIYGFRGSSPAYLIHFPGKKYVLTKNFRSTPAIVEYTETIKPHDDEVCEAVSQDTEAPKPIIIHATFDEFEEYLIAFLKAYQKDLSNVAILCPTKGNRLNHKGDVYGLARIATMLDAHGLPFVQLYSEARASKTEETSVNYHIRSGHVNLLTYHGSKGREWDVVICGDMWYELMNRTPTEQDHNANRYLLYVVTTRAKRQLITFMGTERRPNPWLLQTPVHLYDGFIYSKGHHRFRESEAERIYSVTEAIYDINSEDLLTIEPNLTHTKEVTRVWRDFRVVVSEIVDGDEVLLGIFLENLFSLQCAVSRQETPRNLAVVENIISGEIVVVSNKHFSTLHKLWCACSSWDSYEKIRANMPPEICNLVIKYFRPRIPWEKHLITCNSYMDILMRHRQKIAERYRRYKEATTWLDVLEDLFYLTVVSYAYTNNHLFYIKDDAKRKRHLLHHRMRPLFAEMGEYATQFAQTPYEEQIECSLLYPELNGVVDWRFHDEQRTLVEFKASQSDLTIFHLLQLYCYAFATSSHIDEVRSQRCILFNFLSGTQTEIYFTLDDEHVMDISNALCRSAGAQITKMGVVYDLETTGFIYGNNYPNILQISVKDYNYGFYLLKNVFIKGSFVEAFITELTTITQEQVDGGIGLDEVRERIGSLFEFTTDNTQWIAHNGACFDHRIMKYYDLFPKTFACIDSKSIIRTLGNRKYNLELKKVHFDYFGEKIKDQHTSMGDVEALDRILKYLHYEL